MSEENKTEEQEQQEATGAEAAKANLEKYLESGELPEAMQAEEEQEASKETTSDAQTETEKTTEQETSETEAENTDSQQSTENTETDEKPENAAFARLRHKNKELERKLAELEKKPAPQSESLETSVDKLVKVWTTGEGDEAAHLSDIRKSGSKELYDVYQKAVAGEYGDHSEDVIKSVTEAMQMARVREEQDRSVADERRKAVEKALREEREMVKSDFPDYSKEDSEASKHMQEFTANVLGNLDPETGEIDGKGILPDELAMYYHSHPYVKHQLADLIFKASRKNSDSAQKRVSELEQEVASLKGRLSRYVDLSGPSHKKGGEGAASGTAAEAKSKLTAYMGATD